MIFITKSQTIWNQSEGSTTVYKNSIYVYTEYVVPQDFYKLVSNEMFDGWLPHGIIAFKGPLWVRQ